MNKDDFKAIEDLAELATGDNPGAAFVELEHRLRLVPAIIARQLTIANEHRKHQATGGGALIGILTRIADQGDQKERIKELERLLAHAAKERIRRIDEIQKLQPTSPDAEKTLNNLTKLLNEDDGDGEYLERAMAIVNDWRKKQGAFPHPIDDALVEACREFFDKKDDFSVHTVNEQQVLEVPINDLDKLKTAYRAAHEKAVTDGT